MATLLLIETGQDKTKPNPVNRGNAAPPFALESLAGYIINRELEKPESERINVRVVAQEQLKKEEIANYSGEDIRISPEVISEMVLKMEQPVIVGIRAVTPLFNDALLVAKAIKSKAPGVKVLIGGYHSSGSVESVGEQRRTNIFKSKKYNKWENDLQRQFGEVQLVDCFAVGEGEATLYEAVNAFIGSDSEKKNSEILKDLPGVIYRDIETKKEFVNQERNRLGESRDGFKFYDSPQPYRKITIPIKNQEGEISELREIPSSIGRLQTGTEIPHYDIREIQSNYTRGCPHDCAFCDSGCVWSNYLTLRPSEKVVEEIARLNVDPEYRINYVYFADLTFNMASVQMISLMKAMQNIRVRENGETYFADKLTKQQISSGLDNGRVVFGHESNDQVHWFGLSQVFNFVEGKEENIVASFVSKLDQGKRVENAMEVVSRAPELLEELRFSPHDFIKLLEDNPSSLYDSMECVSDKIKVKLSAVLGEHPTHKYVEELFRYLGFPKRRSFDANELIREMRKSGCSKLGFGIEGFSLGDIVRQKSLDHRLSGGITDYEYSHELINQLGVERFAQTAMTLHVTKNEGMFTRGYFIWGSETQNANTFERAKILLSLELPDKVFKNYGILKKCTAHLFEKINEIYPEDNDEKRAELKTDDVKAMLEGFLDDYVRIELGSELEITENDFVPENRTRFLDIDHLRIGYETPYQSTEAGHLRKMRCAEAYRDSEGVLLRDGSGKLIYKKSIELSGEKLILEYKIDIDGKVIYTYPDSPVVPVEKIGQPVDKEDMKSLDYVENVEVSGKTLNELVKDGWDDWEYLFQETPVLESGVSLRNLMEQPIEIIDYFYGCESYRRSIERRIKKFPEQKEACYAWQKFWQEARGIDFLSERVRREVAADILNKAEEVDESKRDSWIADRILSEDLLKINEIREAKVGYSEYNRRPKLK